MYARFNWLVTAFLTGFAAFAASAADPYPFSVGAGLFGRFSLNTGKVPVAESHSMAFAGMPDLGASVYIPISRKERVGVVADIAYATYAQSYSRTLGTKTTDYTRTVNYLTITPGISFEPFYMAVAIGLPMGTERKNKTEGTVEEESFTVIKPGSNPPMPEQITPSAKDNLNMLIEPRVGIIWPLFHNQGSGRLNLTAHVGYMVTTLFKESYYPQASLTQYNPSFFSFGLGVQYMLEL
jgi:hypothetical protein